MTQGDTHLLNMLISHFQNCLHVFDAIFDEFIIVLFELDFGQEVAYFAVILNLARIGVTWCCLATLGSLRGILGRHVIRNVLRDIADRRW